MERNGWPPPTGRTHLTGRTSTRCTGLVTGFKDALAQCDRCGRLWVHPSNQQSFWVPKNWRRMGRVWGGKRGRRK